MHIDFHLVAQWNHVFNIQKSRGINLYSCSAKHRAFELALFVFVNVILDMYLQFSLDHEGKAMQENMIVSEDLQKDYDHDRSKILQL